MELKRFRAAQSEAVRTLEELYRQVLPTVGEKQASVFQMHAVMLEDPDYTGDIERRIRAGNCTAESAVRQTCDQFYHLFAALDDPYLRGRAADVRDVSERVLRILCGAGAEKWNERSEPVVLAAEDLLPSETIQMDPKHILAFVTRDGSKTSHTAILARTLGIPAVVGLKEQFDGLRDGQAVVVNGSAGEVLLDVEPDVLAEYRRQSDQDRRRRQLLREMVGKQSISLDGHRVELNANIGQPADVNLCLENDAEGIGLFRSEFLYMESNCFPGEDAQLAAYREVLQRMNGKRVVIRTLDLGADKHVPYFQFPHEDNPAMGCRAIRICLQKPDLFCTQLRALHRASVYGRLAIMFPMIVSVAEIRKIKEFIAQTKRRLDAAGIAYADDIEYGVMIETPAAVMVSGELAKEVDFFSIGTNDLTQYTLACDRMNPAVGEIYDTRNPAVMRMIAYTVKKAHENGIWVGVCGESASDPALLPYYLAMKMEELSVPPAAILELRGRIVHTDASGVDLSAFAL